MAFTSPQQHNQPTFSVEGRMAKTEPEADEKWTNAILYAHERAYWICQHFLLTANGRECKEADFSAESFGQLWRNSGECLQAKALDFNHIDLLEEFPGEVPKTADGKDSKRFTMIGLWATTRYRKDFIAFLQAERIPPDVILLAFPLTRGKHDGMFNLKMTNDTH